MACCKNKYRKICFTRDEIYLIHGVIVEVFFGFKLNKNEMKIVKSKERGKSFQRKISSLMDENISEYYILLSLYDVFMIRNALFVAMMRFNKNDLYHIHLGCEVDECLELLRRIDWELLSWNYGDSHLIVDA